MSRIKERYTSEVAPALQEAFSYKSAMQIPRMEKIVPVSYTHLTLPTIYSV